MKQTKVKACAFRGAAIFAAAVFALILTACPNSTGGSDSAGTITPPVPKYTITFAVDGSNGTLKAIMSGTEFTSSFQAKQGTVITFSAMPSIGHAVDVWTLNGNSLPDVKANTYKYTVTANAEVKVRFKTFTDKNYNIGGVQFTMKAINAVENKSVGNTDDGGTHNQPHNISLSSYLIGETEITQELWQKITGTNPSGFNSNPDGTESQVKRPVEQVNWFDCIVFCNKLTKQAGMADADCVYMVDGHVYGSSDAAAKKVPQMNMNKKGFRLPTEAEWEWAAKGGTENKWAGTNEKPQLKNYAWYSESDGGDANSKTHEVKKKSANEYGLYDMTGNVDEWCWDLPTNSTPEGGQDPTGPADNTGLYLYRVTRGGGYSTFANQAFCAFRTHFKFDDKAAGLGLRVVQRP